jgi:hypothetical protein
MTLEYVSENNKYMLIYKGFLHVKEWEYDNKIYWKYSEYKKIHCKGRVHVLDDKVTKYIEHNNHVPNTAKIEAKKVISTLKKNASQTTLIHILVT